MDSVVEEEVEVPDVITVVVVLLEDVPADPLEDVVVDPPEDVLVEAPPEVLADPPPGGVPAGSPEALAGPPEETPAGFIGSPGMSVGLDLSVG